MTNLQLQRVVVTGMGAITPIGNTLNDYWEGLTTGRNGIDKTTHFDVSDFACRFSGQVKDFDPCEYIDRKDAKRMDRFAQLGVCASQQALTHSGLTINDQNAEHIGVLLGTGIGGIGFLEEQIGVIASRGPSRCSPFTIPMIIANMAAGLTAIHVGAKGPNSCTVTACAAGANSIGDAFRLIQRGFAQAMICGGTEAPITPLSVAGFSSAKALSFRNDDPQKASRPFDKDRDGFVMGEGSGILILESLDHALARKATIYGEIVGYGMTCDAFHMTAPPPGGEGAVRAMALALKDGQISPDQVSYINAHGTSTPANDINETKAIKTVFGESAYKIPVSSTKSMTGHLLGGSGGIEAVASILALYHNRIPPTINHDTPDPECDLDYVPYHSREQELHYVMSNSFGFGGHNVALLFKKYQP